MKKVVLLPSFEKSVRHLTAHERKLLVKNLEAFNEFLVVGRAPYGFRLKKIGQGKYEFRVDIRLRVVVKTEDDRYFLVLAGSHDNVKRYLLNS